MKTKSFWSSIPGLITGIAGLCTGIAALIGLLLQLGVVGDKDDNASANNSTDNSTNNSTNSTDAPSAAKSGSNSESPIFSVSPTSVQLDQLLAKEAKVTVKNSGESSISVESPKIEGSDASQFAVDDVNCTGSKIPAGESCEMKVQFTPKVSGRFSATLEISVEGTSKTSDVALRGQAVL